MDAILLNASAFLSQLTTSQLRQLQQLRVELSKKIDELELRLVPTNSPDSEPTSFSRNDPYRNLMCEAPGFLFTTIVECSASVAADAPPAALLALGSKLGAISSAWRREYLSWSAEHTHMELAGVSVCDVGGQLKLLRRCPKLAHLKVASSSEATDTVIREVALHCPLLQHLDLAHCGNITDAAVREVALHCPLLQHLELAGYVNITDAAVREVALHCPLLQHLNLIECGNITDAAVREVALHYPLLQHLYLAGYVNITDATSRKWR